MCVPALHHLISWISEGIPVDYPKVKLVLNEFGVAWLPWVMWRMDAEWRAAKDVPWLTKRPSEYIRESVRFTTQPLEEPEDPKDLVRLLELIHGDEILIFSSDYPHWDADEPDSAGFRPFPEDWLRKIFWENPRRLYADKLAVLESGELTGAAR
jgi:predicted TIM-barrel fold metal-dependent hydrolase